MINSRDFNPWLFATIQAVGMGRSVVRASCLESFVWGCGVHLIPLAWSDGRGWKASGNDSSSVSLGEVPDGRSRQDSGRAIYPFGLASRRTMHA